MSEERLVTVHVGKNGLTDQVISEIRSILRKYKTARVKMLKTSLEEKDKKTMLEELKKKTKARHAKMIGHIVNLKQ
ncbi:MAG: YhbY family RNA-binding protein [Candidatus Altiarchaeota archaeon]|nr:YhbY family RNA-binding protein [Candidatus Altiarchaeota archaeon]